MANVCQNQVKGISRADLCLWSIPVLRNFLKTRLKQMDRLQDQVDF